MARRLERIVVAVLCEFRARVALVVMVLVLVAGCGSVAASGGACPEKPDGATVAVEVVRVVDGDTVEISPAVEGISTVRMIGVDTPETVDPEGPVERGGPAASKFTTAELGGERVGLEVGAEAVDPYGRLLAYVWTEEGLFEERLVAGGYAEVMTIPPNDKYARCLEAV